MNQNTALTLGAIVVLAIGGLLLFMNPSGTPSGDATSTPTATTPTTGTTQPPPASQEPGKPGVVTGGVAVPTDTTAVVTGTVNPNGALTTYWYEYGMTSSLGGRIASQTIGSGYTGIAAPGYITLLSKNTTYFYRLVAQNSFGTVVGLQRTFTTTEGTPPPVGSVPSVKTSSATGVSSTAANLNGEVNPNKNATQYWFEYGKTRSLGSVTGFASVGDGSATLPATVVVSNLEPSTTYYFRLNAQNQLGTVNGAIVSFKTAAPAAPDAPSADTQKPTAITSTSATLHGVVNPQGAQTMYWFEYSIDSLLGQALLSTSNKQSAGSGTKDLSIQANVSGLRPNTTYYVRLVAQNSEGTVHGDRVTFKTAR